MTRFFACLAVIVLVVCLLPTAVWAQSEKQGIALYNEAVALTNAIPTIESPLEKKKQALVKFDEAFAIFERTRSSKWQATTLEWMGHCYRELWRFQVALAHYEKALEIHHKIRDKEAESQTLRYMANIHKISGQYQNAIESYEKALLIARKTRNAKLECTILHETTSALKLLGEYEKARYFHEQAGDKNGEAESLDHLGEICHSLGEYQNALAFHKKALAIRDKNGIATELTRDSITNIYLDLGDTLKAKEIKPPRTGAGLWAPWETDGRIYLVQSLFNDAIKLFE